LHLVDVDQAGVVELDDIAGIDEDVAHPAAKGRVDGAVIQVQLGAADLSFIRPDGRLVGEQGGLEGVEALATTVSYCCFASRNPWPPVSA
jgi:hypothetical protein